MEGERASMMTVNGRGARATGSERERVPSDRGWSERRRVGDGEPRRRVGEVVLGLPTGVCLEEDHHRPQGALGGGPPPPSSLRARMRGIAGERWKTMMKHRMKR